MVRMQRTDMPSMLYRSGRQDAFRIVVPRGETDAVSLLTGRAGVIDIDAETWTAQLGPILMLMGLAAFLLYALLGAQFESFLLPLVFMLLVPLDAAGAVAALALFGYPLNLNALLSVLVILGLSVNNAILLFVHFRDRLPGRGSPLFSIYRGTESRLRPVLITYFTTVLALLPVAISLTGDNGQSGMALAIIGGLTTTTLISLLIYPWVFYRYFLMISRRSVE